MYWRKRCGCGITHQKQLNHTKVVSEDSYDLYRRDIHENYGMKKSGLILFT